MIKKRPANERGMTTTGWLNSHHSFSFNRYYDPRYTGFRHLVVINEDFVAPARGFGTHSHRDMEIISYVLKGSLEHRDSLGTSSVIRPGEVQRMSAGTGVTHSESNPSTAVAAHFLQIWIEPERAGLVPSYEQKEFPAVERQGKFRLVASRAGRDGSVTVHQDVELSIASLSAADALSYALKPGRHAWLQVLEGAVTTLNETALAAGDGAAVSDEERIAISAVERSEIMLFDLA